MSPPDRRAFLQSSAAGGLGFLAALPPVRAADAKLGADLVRLAPDVEPLVRLIEDTARDKLLEEIGARIKKGLAYRDVLAGLFLAGVRNVPPRPSVGFKFHAVLVVNAAHQAALAGPDGERWLPLFWALDNFKSAQATTQKEGGWRMKPADESKVPDPAKARATFIEAMDEWDVEAADAAVAGLARAATPGELFDLFARYGAPRLPRHRAQDHLRRQRVPRARRDRLGARRAGAAVAGVRTPAARRQEPGGGGPGRRPAGSPERRAGAEARTSGDARPAKGVTGDVLKAVRTGSADDLGSLVEGCARDGIAPRPVWDGLFLSAGELLMRQPGIVGLHTLTTLNALHYAARATGPRTCGCCC
jgi:hypothetical protein